MSLPAAKRQPWRPPGLLIARVETPEYIYELYEEAVAT